MTLLCRESVCLQVPSFFFLSFRFLSSPCRHQSSIETAEPSSDLDTGPKTATEADGSSQQQQQQLENKTSGEGGERGEGGGGERRSQQPPPTALHHVPHDRSLLRSTSPGRLSHFGTRLSVRSSPVIRPLRVSSAKRKACGAVRHPRLKSASLCR